MLLLFGLLLSIWSMPALAQDVPSEAAIEDAAAEASEGEDAGAAELAGTGEGDDSSEAEAAAEVEEAQSPWSTGLITSMAALIIGGFSAVLGIWVDRDKSRPVVFAVVMSILITTAIGVGATQSYLDAIDAIQQKEDLDRMLNMVGELASSSGDESLAALVKAEGGEVVMQAAEEPPVEDAEPPAADLENQ